MKFKFLATATLGIFLAVTTALSTAYAGVIITSSVILDEANHALKGATFTLAGEILDGTTWGNLNGGDTAKLTNVVLDISGAAGTASAYNGTYTSNDADALWFDLSGNLDVYSILTGPGYEALYRNNSGDIQFTFFNVFQYNHSTTSKTGQTIVFADFADVNLAVFGYAQFIPYKVPLGYSNDGAAAFKDFSIGAASTSVPEPHTLAIFTLGMIGLASRRFKKQS
jgi:hypothetical protein